MSWEDDAAARLESWLQHTRLCDLGLLMTSGSHDRSSALRRALRTLPPSAYLVGCGPYNCGVFPLLRDRTTVGRDAWPGEEQPSPAPEIIVRDGITLGPREVSRRHLRISRQSLDGQTMHFIEDLGSTNGTFLNGKPLPAPGAEPVPLADLDVLSVGPSQVNVFIFLIVPSS